MESSKLVALLKQFNTDEWNAFNRFIQSPYYNSRPKVIQLFQILKKEAPLWKPKRIVKTVIYKKLFPNEAYKEQRLVELRNAVVKLIEQFWVVHQKKDTIQNYKTLAIAYHQHQFENYRDACFDKSIQILNNKGIDAETYHNNLFDLSLAKHTIIEGEGKRNQEPNLQALHDHFDAFYLCTKLKYYYKVLNYQNFRSHDYNISMVDEVLAEAVKEKYQIYPSIQIYYHGVYTLLSLDNEKNFYALRDLLKLHTHNFSIEELQNIFVLARNFCLKNLNRGKRKFIKDALDLYKTEISEEIIFEANKISNSSCRNIVKLALLQGEVNWVINFLNQYKENISDELHSLSMANVYFEQRQYKKILDLLLPTNFKEVLLELAARGLILKTYFHLCRNTQDFIYEEKLEAYIESFNAFLKRKKEVLTRGYLLYLNLVDYVNKINKLYWQPKFNKAKLANIHQQILATPETAEWEWLKKISKV